MAEPTEPTEPTELTEPTAEPSADAAPRPAPGRLVGVDAARGVALLGMFAVHVLPDDATGASGLVRDAASGRSAALFAVLAGVGLALSVGGPRVRPQLGRARRGIAGRAAVIAAIGLTLGAIPTPAAVILPYYAVLFLLALPVLGRPARRLLPAALAVALVAPVLSQLLRLGSAQHPGPNLSWADLADPLPALWILLVAGYYPALTWSAYLLLGLGLGRLQLHRPELARRLLLTGVLLAALAAAGSALAVHLAGGVAGLNERLPAGSSLAGRGGHLLLDTFYGTTPSTSWWFLGVAAPHSGAPADLVGTAGAALAVLGAGLLLAPRAGRALRPLAAAGSMTLTLYSAHVLALGFVAELPPGDRPPAWPTLAVQAGLALAAATLWGSPGRRGPLEELAALGAELAGGRPVARSGS